MWILTEEYNDYSQHGEYFVAAFVDKPSKDQLILKLDGNYGEYWHPLLAQKLLETGCSSQFPAEQHWYNLFEYEE